jgi:hypothetical protein
VYAWRVHGSDFETKRISAGLAGRPMKWFPCTQETGLNEYDHARFLLRSDADQLNSLPAFRVEDARVLTAQVVVPVFEGAQAGNRFPSSDVIQITAINTDLNCRILNEDQVCRISGRHG